MIKFSRTVVGMLAIVCAMVFASCEKDEKELKAPEYEEYSARYEVTTPSSGIQSVEFTSAGNYIILEDNGYRGDEEGNKVSGKKARFIQAVSRLQNTRAYSNIIEGSYTIDADGNYVLDGFGKIKVVQKGGNVYSLVVIYPDGSEKTLEAAKKTQYPDSVMTNNLCRTWDAKKVQLYCKIDKYKFDETVDVRDYPTLVKKFVKWVSSIGDFEDGDIDEGDVEIDLLPQQVIFSKAGTYMVKYLNNSLAISTWAWKNQDEGILRYSWNYDDMDDYDEAGIVRVAFKGDGMLITESLLDDYDGDDDEDDDYYGDFRMDLTWHFVQ